MNLPKHNTCSSPIHVHTYLLKNEGSFVVPHVLFSGVRLALQVLSKVREGLNIGETS